MSPRTKNFEERLLEDLKEPDFAAEYLDAVLNEDDPEAFLLALRQVAQAHGMSYVAKLADLGRESMYKTLSEDGNPGLRTLSKILEGLNLRLAVRPRIKVAA